LSIRRLCDFALRHFAIATAPTVCLVSRFLPRPGKLLTGALIVAAQRHGHLEHLGLGRRQPGWQKSPRAVGSGFEARCQFIWQNRSVKQTDLAWEGLPNRQRVFPAAEFVAVPPGLSPRNFSRMDK
jgi:hypothetical protein